MIPHPPGEREGFIVLDKYCIEFPFKYHLSTLWKYLPKLMQLMEECKSRCPALNSGDVNAGHCPALSTASSPVCQPCLFGQAERKALKFLFLFNLTASPKKPSFVFPGTTLKLQSWSHTGYNNTIHSNSGSKLISYKHKQYSQALIT